MTRKEKSTQKRQRQTLSSTSECLYPKNGKAGLKRKRNRDNEWDKEIESEKEKQNEMKSTDKASGNWTMKIKRNTTSVYNVHQSISIISPCVISYSPSNAIIIAITDLIHSDCLS